MRVFQKFTVYLGSCNMSVAEMSGYTSICPHMKRGLKNFVKNEFHIWDVQTFKFRNVRYCIRYVCNQPRKSLGGNLELGFSCSTARSSAGKKLKTLLRLLCTKLCNVLWVAVYNRHTFIRSGNCSVKQHRRTCGLKSLAISYPEFNPRFLCLLIRSY